MEAILNFIKEALAGKKMSASWIVTIAIAIAGISWTGTLAWQEYNKLIKDVAHLQSTAHAETPPYDDSPLSARVTANSDGIIKLQARPNLANSVKINSESIVGMKERIKSLESQIIILMKDIEKTEIKIDNKNVNPLSLWLK